MEFEVKSFDDALVKCAGAEGGPEHNLDGLSFQQHGRFKAKNPLDVFLSHEGVSRAVKKQVSNGARASDNVPVGIAYMEDVYINSRTGLIFDLRNRRCWRGNLLNQSNIVFTRTVARHFSWGQGEASVLLDEEIIRKDCLNLKAGIHIVGGGYNVYGHWLVDFLPRLARVADFDLSLNPVVRMPDAGWAMTLMNCIVPEAAPQHCVSGADWYHAERLIVPTTARFNFTLQHDSVLTAWSMLKQSLSAGAVDSSGPCPKRIFVSRRKLKRKVRDVRLISNIVAVERVAERAGFAIISPETLPLPEQARLFSHAEVILGEDGSGLHNSIFSRPGTRVGIIGLRSNSLHAAIASVLDQKVYYIEPTRRDEGEEDGAGSPVPIRDLKTAIEELVS